MKESSKTRKLAGDSFPSELLKGRGIDIGCGKDVVSENAEPFDRPDGDANRILDYKPEGAYDFVFSSHSLEHMHDPFKCINDWFRLLKPGGHMILTVPDCERYEQGVFPSTFNADHKHQFTMNGGVAGPNIIRVDELVGTLKDCELVSIKLEDFNYDYSLMARGGTPLGIFTGRLLSGGVLKLKKSGITLNENFLRILARGMRKAFGTRIDQTLLFDATAQIQLVLRRKR